MLFRSAHRALHAHRGSPALEIGASPSRFQVMYVCTSSLDREVCSGVGAPVASYARMRTSSYVCTYGTLGILGAGGPGPSGPHADLPRPADTAFGILGCGTSSPEECTVCNVGLRPVSNIRVAAKDPTQTNLLGNPAPKQILCIV